ncbi:MAG: DMT family transporter [Hylemonella sp.]
MMRAAQDGAFERAMPSVFVLIWSTGFIVARYGMPHAPPLSFLSWRYAFSVGCFLLWILLAGVRWPTKTGQWMHLAVAGILMHGGYLGGVWSAIKTGMGAGLSALIVGLQPVLTAVWLSARGGQVSTRQWAGLLLGLLGLALVVSQKIGMGGEIDLQNLSLAVLGLLSITLGTLYQKRFVQACDVRSANAVQMTAALAVTLPLALLLEHEPIRWSDSLGYVNLELAGAMAWSVLGLSLGGSSLLYLLIQRGAATAVTSLLYLVPPCTALLAWLLFDEPFTVLIVLGTVLCAIGVGLVVRDSR